MSREHDDLEVIGTAVGPRPRPPRPPRSRRRTTLVLALAAALIVGGGVLAGTARRHDRNRGRGEPATVVPAVSPSTPTRVPSSLADAEFVGQMGLIAPGVGWALNGYALYRTVDDGAHWSNITPPGTVDPIAHIYALDFLDADHAWAAVAINSQPLRIFRTGDGGRSWRPNLPNVCGTTSLSRALPCGSPISIDFVDSLHGWSLFSVPRSRGTLLETRDGGITWRVASRTPFSGRLHFVDASNGWAVSDPSDFQVAGVPSKPGGAVYHTADGGKTWKLVIVPTPEAIGSLPLAIGAPQFLGREGIVATRLLLQPSGPRLLVVYRSLDLGTTWTMQHTPSTIHVRFTETAGYRFSAPTASDWVLLAGTKLYVTHDGGRHWTTREPTVGRPVDVDFTTPSRGWLLAMTPSCTKNTSGPCVNSVLFRTHDGGATWQPLSPAIGITADRLP